MWWIDGGGFSLQKRTNWLWTIMIRQPEFVNEEVFKWAKVELKKRKPELQVEKLRLEAFEEGLCVQMMHIGPYATEPETMSAIEAFLKQQGLQDRLGAGGKHHEIYLSDPRKSKPETTKTVLWNPVVRV